MRRKQCEIASREEIEKILGRARIGRLATVDGNGFPYITPVNYVWWQGSVYFHCAHQGEKIENIARDNRVCFEVDIPLAYVDLAYDATRPVCQLHQLYHCVIIRGRAEVVCDIDEKVGALNALVASHEQGRPFMPLTAETQAVHLCSVVAVRIESISGKSDLAQKKEGEERRRMARYLAQRDLPGDREAASLLEER